MVRAQFLGVNTVVGRPGTDSESRGKERLALIEATIGCIHLGGDMQT